jgi:hypothetical protein
MRELTPIALLLFVACAANGQSKSPTPQIQEHTGNTVVMDDGFEYAILDYGVGQVQVRSAEKPNSLSPNLFWVKVAIRNTDEHLIKTPRYFRGFNSWRVQDNWGNTYYLNRPDASDLGGNWSEASLPIPEEQKSRDSYKPGESSMDNALVKDIREFQIYLHTDELINPKSCFYRIAQPLGRRRNLMRSQSDPEPSELQITVVTETYSLPTPHRRR